MFLLLLSNVVIAFDFSIKTDLPICSKFKSSFTEDEMKSLNMCQATVMFEGFIFRGEIRGGQPNGNGTISYDTGMFVEGEFKDGEIVEGKITYQDKSTYEGEFFRYKKHGYGVEKYADGARYEGQFLNNERQGYGKIFYNDGSVAEGNFINGVMEGQGKYSFSNDSIYIGEFTKGNITGAGKYTFIDGSVAEGNFINGVIEGQGMYYYSNGDVYSGDFTKGNITGFGKYTYKDGHIYEGTFLNGISHGKGKTIYKNESVYEGDYKDGYETGIGTYSQDNGKYVAKGEFVDGLLNGQGKVFWKGTAEFEGEFSGGDRNGDGFVKYLKQFKQPVDDPQTINGKVWPSESSYKGQYKDDFKDGQGIANFKGLGEFKVTCIKGECKTDEKVALGHNKKKEKNLPKEQDKKAHKKRIKSFEIPSIDISPQAKNIPEIDVNPSNKPQGLTENKPKYLPVGSGSGFAVGEQGYIVTNNHVIDGCEVISIVNGAEELTAKLISKDEVNDLAILKGDFVPLDSFALTTENPELLQEIYVAGYPFGYSVSKSVKVTKGIISSLSGLGNNFSNLQIDAAIQPGNSGGPIIDKKGNLVGVAVSKLDLQQILEMHKVVPENVNFGIKSNTLNSLLVSNNVESSEPNYRTLKTSSLGKKITNATFFLSCYMTENTYKKMLKTKKTLNQDVKF